MQKLQSIGLNVFPEEDSDKYVSVKAKNAGAEMSLYQNMALTATAFAYSWSKWNSEAAEKGIIVQASEQLSEKFLSEVSCDLIVYSAVHCCKVCFGKYLNK